MKLLFCTDCADVIKLDYVIRTCKCGKCSGKYLPDGDNVEISERSMLIGLTNSSLQYMVGKCWNEKNKYNLKLDGYIFPYDYEKITRLKDSINRKENKS